MIRIKLLMLILLGSIATSLLSFEKTAHTQSYAVVANEDSPKLKALKILQTKCNVCHKKRNPFMIFKLKNMDRRAKKVYKEVFVKKRMPKGNDIKLTEDEYNTLEVWLNENLKKKPDGV